IPFIDAHKSSFLRGSAILATDIQFWKYFPFIEFHEFFLLRSDLMNADVVVTCVSVLAYGLQVLLGIRSAAHGFQQLLRRNELPRLFEVRWQSEFLQEWARQSGNRPDLLRRFDRALFIFVVAYGQFPVAGFITASLLLKLLQHLAIRSCADQPIS